MKFAKITLVLSLSLFTVLSYAGGWSNFTKVASIHQESSGNVYVSYQEMNNFDGCSSSGWLVLLTTNSAFKTIYSALLTAKVANLDIRYYESTCSTGGYPVLIHTWIK